MSRIKVLVLTGFGLNCDIETAFAFEVAGARAERVHLNELVAGERRLQDYQVFVIGGGFSWGDDHGAGVIMAMRLKHRLRDDLLQFIAAGGLVLGICNGFQVLVNLGLLPAFEPRTMQREAAIIGNDCGGFRNHWVQLVGNSASPCILTRGIDRIELPVRHGEGKFYAEEPVLDRLIRQEQVILRYARADGTLAAGLFPDNPSGSLCDIAGICDPTGRIAGLMPHPEAFNHAANHPDWTYRNEQARRVGRHLPEAGDGILMFRNLVNFFA